MAGNEDFEGQLRLLLAKGRKIEAVKLYRERTGAGLAEAKAAVEALERSETPTTKQPADSDLETNVVPLLEQGKKIEAIKVYRELSGVGLKEAKEAVEALAAERHIMLRSGSGCLGVTFLIGVTLVAALATADHPTPKVSEAKPDDNGFLVHTTQSPFQAGQTEIRVLQPDRLEPGKRYPAIYVLPAEARNKSQFGDGLLEVKQRNLHNKHHAVFVAPAFSNLPWYADHPTDPKIRQESHLLKVVVPFVEKQYPVQEDAGGRFLLGFSKSGWGALSLLLRHPAFFGKAAAWDAPLTKAKPDQFGMEGIFGTPENFEKYRITKLLQQRATDLRGGHRLVLTGYANFRQHHQEAHDLLTKLGVPHEYRDGPERKHDWHSGWMDEAVELLLKGR